jgi:hypothetical protein
MAEYRRTPICVAGPTPGAAYRLDHVVDELLQAVVERVTAAAVSCSGRSPY